MTASATSAGLQPATRPSRSARLRGQLQSTPGRLRAWSLVGAALALAFALAGSASINARSAAIGDAQIAAQRLALIQSARTSIVEADSIATTSFLLGGLEDPERRATYEARLTDSISKLTSIAGDARTEAALADAGAAVTRYAGLVEQARANNRQGLPVGSAYQRQASTLVRDVVIDKFDQIDGYIRADINGSLATSGRATLWLHLPALASIGTLVAAALWLARRTKRLVNPTLIAATVLLATAWALGGSSAAAAGTNADTTARGSLTQFDQMGQGRSAAFDARSLEALTLIARGSGDAYEQAWQAQADLADRQLTSACTTTTTACASRDQLSAYRSLHVQVRTLDNDGKWDQAVALALGTGEAAAPPNADSAFRTFATESATVTESLAALTDAEFDTARTEARWTRWLVLFAGIAAAGMVIAAYNPRLREYR